MFRSFLIRQKADKVSVSAFFDTLKRSGVSFFAGVPDSLLKDFCAFVTDNCPKESHIISANEGAAVALAVGHHLGTRQLPLVYTQNSGFGNMVNPLLSLAERKVYSIPLIVLVGWRGEPGKRDEPQHEVMGALQENILRAMEIPFAIVPKSSDEACSVLEKACEEAMESQCPYILLVRKGTFEQYNLKSRNAAKPFELTREEVLDVVTDSFGDRALFVGTTGVLSRELYELRDRKFFGDHSSDFLCVGNMGHASSIASALAATQSSRPIVCLDGDGAALMHLGNMAISGQGTAGNFVHILVNNGLHESVGGQPTVGFDVDFCQIAKACGYRSAVCVSTKADIRKAIENVLKEKACLRPAFIEVKVAAGMRSDLGRPKTSPLENKLLFMDRILQSAPED